MKRFQIISLFVNAQLRRASQARPRSCIVFFPLLPHSFLTAAWLATALILALMASWSPR